MTMTKPKAKRNDTTRQKINTSPNTPRPLPFKEQIYLFLQSCGSATTEIIAQKVYKNTSARNRHRAGSLLRVLKKEGKVTVEKGVWTFVMGVITPPPSTEKTLFHTQSKMSALYDTIVQQPGLCLDELTFQVYKTTNPTYRSTTRSNLSRLKQRRLIQKTRSNTWEATKQD